MVIQGDESQFTLTILLTAAAGLPGREGNPSRLATPLLREGLKIENDATHHPELPPLVIIYCVESAPPTLSASEVPFNERWRVQCANSGSSALQVL